MMSANNRNPFHDPEDVDDDEFLAHPRSGRAGHLLPNANNARNPGDPMQVMLQRRQDIEERTLQSSSRSLGLLYESEKVGQATAEELARQKEQLKVTEQRLDDINSTLRQSERSLQGIKSMFGGIKNYFAGRGASAEAPVGGARPMGAPPASMTTSQSETSMARQQQQGYSMGGPESHPGLQIRGLDPDPMSRPAPLDSRIVDQMLDRNLEDMSSGLSRLKCLANNLNQELDEHNDIIDRVDVKTNTTHMRVQLQNKTMNKILKK